MDEIILNKIFKEITDQYFSYVRPEFNKLLRECKTQKYKELVNSLQTDFNSLLLLTYFPDSSIQIADLFEEIQIEAITKLFKKIKVSHFIDITDGKLSIQGVSIYYKDSEIQLGWIIPPERIFINEFRLSEITFDIKVYIQRSPVCLEDSYFEKNRLFRRGDGILFDIYCSYINQDEHDFSDISFLFDFNDFISSINSSIEFYFKDYIKDQLIQYIKLSYQ